MCPVWTPDWVAVLSVQRELVSVGRKICGGTSPYAVSERHSAKAAARRAL
jgi:hypothetical protein